MDALKVCVKTRHLNIYERVENVSNELIAKASIVIERFLDDKNLEREGLCFAVVGSVGRSEALEASDFDIIPIAIGDDILKSYMDFDQELRAVLREELSVKVSKGEDLTRPVSIAQLVDADTIGGAKDDSGGLTKRVLLLTESRQVGGGYQIEGVRASLLEAYSKENRTSGTHALSLCNDIARYYKTLCIEYKAKVDEEQKDWCTRNIKLRHSRKLWYFSNILAVTFLSERHPHGDHAFKASLLDVFARPPVQRIVEAIGISQPLAVGRLLESYAMFLDFMASPANREALAATNHSTRYSMVLNNPFPAMKFNSDSLHYEIMNIVEELGPLRRARMMSWFLF